MKYYIFQFSIVVNINQKKYIAWPIYKAPTINVDTYRHVIALIVDATIYRNLIGFISSYISKNFMTKIIK